MYRLQMTNQIGMPSSIFLHIFVIILDILYTMKIPEVYIFTIYE